MTLVRNEWPTIKATGEQCICQRCINNSVYVTIYIVSERHSRVKHPPKLWAETAYWINELSSFKCLNYLDILNCCGVSSHINRFFSELRSSVAPCTSKKNQWTAEQGWITRQTVETKCKCECRLHRNYLVANYRYLSEWLPSSVSSGMLYDATGRSRCHMVAQRWMSYCNLNAAVSKAADESRIRSAVAVPLSSSAWCHCA